MTLLSHTIVFLLWMGCTTCKASAGAACEDPPLIDFGEIVSEHKSRYKESDRVQYVCNPGYTLSGSEWVTCHEKIWVPGPPQCLAPCTITKQQLEAQNLLLSNGQRHTFLIQSGRWQKFMCMTGFKLSASPIEKCFNGHIKLPSCIAELQCGSIPKVANAQIEGRKKETYEPGETIRYQCDAGFLTVGLPEIICREGNWTAPPFCEDATCEPPPEIAGGKVQGVKKSRYLPGESARYQCWRGFEMTGASTVACQNGVWTELPKCKGKGGKCGPPPVIENGDLLSFPMQEYPQGTTLEYKCPSLYVLEGSQYITCADGQWTTPPVCLGKGGKCGPPPVIENGDLLSFPMQEYPQGTTLEYKCPSLYVLEGSQYITCADGQWTTPPVCLVACTASEERMERNNIELKWLARNKLYSRSGDFIEFRCKRGYSQAPGSSPFRAQCVEGTLEYPWCKPGKNCTVHERRMETNNIQLQSSRRSSTSTYRSGDFIFFECKWLYQRVSHREAFRAECLDGIIKYPTCERIFG